MSKLKEIAEQFVDACETGKGWEVCRAYCNDAASFSCQAEALAGVRTLAEYTEWMKGMLTPVPDGRYELKAFAVDEARRIAIAYAVFHGTQTGPGGPVPATGKTVAADYVYAMRFDGDRISGLTKVWNDVFSLKQLGWI